VTLAILDSTSAQAGDNSNRIAVAALVVAGISAAITLATVWYTRKQAREATVANALPTAIDLFRDFREMRGARQRVAELGATTGASL